MISALQLYDWEKSFWIGKKTFNLALGMGPYFGPMRALEKGLGGIWRNLTESYAILWNVIRWNRKELWAASDIWIAKFHRTRNIKLCAWVVTVVSMPAIFKKNISTQNLFFPPLQPCRMNDCRWAQRKHGCHGGQTASIAYGWSHMTRLLLSHTTMKIVSSRIGRNSEQESCPLRLP